MNNFKKKNTICIVSSTRADFGILSKFVRNFQRDKSINVKFIVTGSHLEKKYGSTLKEILEEKIKIFKKIKILSNKNDKKSLLNNSSKVITRFSKELYKMSPNLIILLGDRYEIFCIAYCAFILGIPIAHLYGGELTENSLDDSLRHSITKLSNFHFVSTKEYKNRILQLGEDKKNVFHVGSFSVENIRKAEFLSKKTLEKKFKIKLEKKIILCTIHPETNNLANSEKQISASLDLLKKIKHASIIFTMPNDDLGSDFITKKISKMCRDYKNFYLFKSLGQKVYFSFLKQADIILGNSSSGIIEAPSVGTYTINLGRRQSGRVRAKNTYDLDFGRYKILNKIKFIFKKNKKFFYNPYYKSNSIKNTIKIIKKINLNKIKPKKFIDLK